MSFKNEFEKCEGFNQVFDSWFFRSTHKNCIYMRYACFSVVLHTQRLCPFLTEKYGWSNHEATLNELPNQVGNDYRRRTPGMMLFWKEKIMEKSNFCWTLTSFFNLKAKAFQPELRVHSFIYTYYIRHMYIWYLKFRCMTHIDTLKNATFSVVVLNPIFGKFLVIGGIFEAQNPPFALQDADMAVTWKSGIVDGILDSPGMSRLVKDNPSERNGKKRTSLKE